MSTTPVRRLLNQELLEVIVFSLTVVVLASLYVHFHRKSLKTTGTIFHDQVSAPTSQFLEHVLNRLQKSLNLVYECSTIVSSIYVFKCDCRSPGWELGEI